MATSLITVGLGLMVRDAVFLVAGPRIRKLSIDQTVVFDLGLVRIVRQVPGGAVGLGGQAVRRRDGKYAEQDRGSQFPAMHPSSLGCLTPSVTVPAP